MYDETDDSLPFNSSSEFNERKFQFILNYCLAERTSGNGSDMGYAHNRNDLVEAASSLYEKALEICQ
jgi:hypothetical protein